MLLLPTEQASAAETATQRFEANGRIVLSEPCDCAGQVRHNNGGNYHGIWEYARDGGTWVRRGSTSEYDRAEWEPIDDQAALAEIGKKSAAGWRVS